MDGFKGAAEDEEGLKAQGRTQLTRPAAFFRNIILLPVVDRVRTSAAVFVVRALAWYGDALRSRARNYSACPTPSDGRVDEQTR